MFHRNDARWSPLDSSCRSTCSADWNGASGVAGFSQHNCNSYDLQNSNYVGFWCHHSTGDGAVMMLGGGGSNCEGADHGIAITKANPPKFGSISESYDFGDDASRAQTTAYALNLWVR